jgi:PAS domain S-box-containing protein
MDVSPHDPLRLLVAIIDSSDDAIISKNLNSVITSWNKGAQKIFGYTAEEAVGRSITMLIPEGRSDEEPAILNRIRKGEKIEHYETVRCSKDGTLLNISLTVSPIRDQEGNIVGASKIARDITEQRVTQNKLRESEEQYRVTLASIGDGVIATDQQGQITFLNPVAETLTGWKKEEAIGKRLPSIFQIVNEYTREPVENPITRVLREGTIVGMANHTVLIGRDGTERPIADSGAPIRETDGTLKGVVLVFRDVTESHVAELASQRLAAVVESSDDAIISKNLDGIIMSWNKGAERILGYSAAEAVGKPITLLIPPGRLSEEIDIMAKLRAGERIDHFDTVRVTKNGTEIDVSLTISPIKDMSGHIVGASKILRDVSERKQVERELQAVRQQLQDRAEDLENKVRDRTARLQEMVTELETFSYSVSHDLRAPLRAIQQYADILAEDYNDKLDDQGRTYLKRITSSTSRLDALIRDVLTYSRVIRSDMLFESVDTDRLVREIVEQYPNFQPPHAQIEVESPLLPVQGHEAFLTQCLSNLVGNAVKFVVPGQAPHVRISTEKREGGVRICVEDNGIGIEPADMDRIFGMFERSDPEQKYEGTGIGLSIVRKAVERMNGKLGVESELGKGSRFWIEFPDAKIQ